MEECEKLGEGSGGEGGIGGVRIRVAMGEGRASSVSQV